MIQNDPRHVWNQLCKMDVFLFHIFRMPEHHRRRWTLATSLLRHSWKHKKMFGMRWGCTNMNFVTVSVMTIRYQYHIYRLRKMEHLFGRDYMSAAYSLWGAFPLSQVSCNVWYTGSFCVRCIAISWTIVEYGNFVISWEEACCYCIYAQFYLPLYKAICMILIWSVT